MTTIITFITLRSSPRLAQHRTRFKRATHSTTWFEASALKFGIGRHRPCAAWSSINHPKLKRPSTTSARSSKSVQSGDGDAERNGEEPGRKGSSLWSWNRPLLEVEAQGIYVDEAPWAPVWLDALLLRDSCKWKPNRPFMERNP